MGECHTKDCEGKYEFDRIEEGYEIWKCTKCGDEQLPESM